MEPAWGLNWAWGLGLIALTIAISADTPGIFTYNLPVAQLVIICLVAGFAGVLAALLPARRAANLDVLKAISSE